MKTKELSRSSFIVCSLSSLSFVLAVFGCDTKTVAPVSDGGSDASVQQNLSIYLQAEETITDGLEPGAEEENIQDGWTVSYSKYIAAIGHIHLSGNSSASGAELEDETVRIIDLKTVPQSQLLLTSFAAAAGQWTSFEYETPVATATAQRHSSVSQADFDRMVSNECTYLIEGTLSKATGQSCANGNQASCRAATSIRFEICAASPTVFGPCESGSGNGQPGINVPPTGNTQASITLHGDHLFFNAFPVGDEGTIERRAQWLADCDIDGNNLITDAEIRTTTASTLFPSTNYSLAGAPFAINTGWDWARAQLKTQGHVNGEGECPWDGNSHDHDHDHDASVSDGSMSDGGDAGICRPANSDCNSNGDCCSGDCHSNHCH